MTKTIKLSELLMNAATSKNLSINYGNNLPSEAAVLINLSWNRWYFDDDELAKTLIVTTGNTIGYQLSRRTIEELVSHTKQRCFPEGRDLNVIAKHIHAKAEEQYTKHHFSNALFATTDQILIPADVYTARCQIWFVSSHIMNMEINHMPQHSPMLSVTLTTSSHHRPLIIETPTQSSMSEVRELQNEVGHTLQLMQKLNHQSLTVPPFVENVASLKNMPTRVELLLERNTIILTELVNELYRNPLTTLNQLIFAICAVARDGMSAKQACRLARQVPIDYTQWPFGILKRFVLKHK